jgi:hypothetical protein
MAKQVPPRQSIPRFISLAISRAVEGIRVLRQAFKTACPGQPSELESFDEVASTIQTSCTNYQHNTTMHVQAELS